MKGSWKARGKSLNCIVVQTASKGSSLAKALKGKLSCVFFVLLSCAVAFFQTLQHSLTGRKQIKVECQ